MLTSRELKELEKELQEAICPSCIECNVYGKCDLWDLDGCPISAHFPQLVEVVEAVDSNLVSDYVQPIRDNVCSTCKNILSSEGDCDVRHDGRCALDSYLPLILDVIDDYLDRQEQAVG